jgi:hypothetical protein
VEAKMTKKLNLIQIGIIITALITAGIHFTLLFPDKLFILNALAYVTLLIAYFLPALAKFHKIVRWLFILFTALTIGLWIFMGQRSILAYVTKLDEVALIILLFIDQFE